ncbi:uncharacterized protein EV422DRAFT_565266 [Fimicolochytrium jonesii]|uniref:uncharacterized protein n=1 Tax=Fimicolochytrium jonesii TaxID=1396493 RepID=UPI0022FDCEA1|nr:uncharacterized protein EV422DRAFT_565266 [Fimicolochytrium jonesii]KAI8824577.1 hypothetical protein EV422DRAFT_565266 [Fimicolochytrium jonesii]
MLSQSPQDKPADMSSSLAAAKYCRTRAPYKLIGVEMSFFTAKAKAYMRWKQIPFEPIVASADVYRDVIVPLTGVSYIPIVLLPDEEAKQHGSPAIQDTKDIIDYFEARYPSNPVLPPSPLARFAAMLVELVADEWLILIAMQWRWGAPHFAAQEKWVWTQFGSGMFAEPGTEDAAIDVGKKSGKHFQRMLPSLGITAASGYILDQQYHHLLRQLSQHFEKHAYLLGSAPCLADFALYGPLYAHLARDPVPGTVMRQTAPLVFEWVERMGGVSDWSGLRGCERAGAALGDEPLPDTLSLWLRPLLQDLLPVLLSTATATETFLSKRPNPAAPLPRSIGTHRAVLHAPPGDIVEIDRAVMPSPLWMVERIAQRVYRDDAVGACDAWLAEAFGENTKDMWGEVVRGAGRVGLVRRRNVLFQERQSEHAAKL